MGDVKPAVLVQAGTALRFWCPGCKDWHAVVPKTGDSTKEEARSQWTWNGDLVAPTFRPSIKVTASSKSVCHSYVTNGFIEFLADSTHALQGCKVPLPPPPAAG